MLQKGPPRNSQPTHVQSSTYYSTENKDKGDRLPSLRGPCMTAERDYLPRSTSSRLFCVKNQRRNENHVRACEGWLIMGTNGKCGRIDGEFPHLPPCSTGSSYSECIVDDVLSFVGGAGLRLLYIVLCVTKEHKSKGGLEARTGWTNAKRGAICLDL